MTSVGPNGENYCLFGRLLYKYREDGQYVTCEVDHPGYTEEERNNKENLIQLKMFSGAAKPQWICIRKENEACLSLEFTAQLASSNKSESRIVPVYFPKGDFRPVLLLCHIWFVKFQKLESFTTSKMDCHLLCQKVHQRISVMKTKTVFLLIF